MSIFLGLMVIACMLVLNGIFAAYEMALASVSRARLHVLVGRKLKGAPEAAFMKDNMEASLAVVQLGITLVGAVAAATGGVSAADLIGPALEASFGIPEFWANALALLLVVVPLSSFTIIFAELVPKMIALKDHERVCLRLSPMMKGFSIAITPVVRVFEAAVKLVMRKLLRFDVKPEENSHLHELQAAAMLARTSRLIGAREEKIVVAAAGLSSRKVREIMIPLTDMCTIPVTASLSDALIRAHMDMHTRFPVCGAEGEKAIYGYVNFKDIMAALKLNPSDPTVKGILRPIRSVEWDATIASALESMIQGGQHIVLVAAKDKGPVGMLTLEDIIEELVGEIEDEFDRFAAHIHPFAGGWIVGGGVTMGVLGKVIGRLIVPENEGQTRLADWCSLHKEGAFEGGEVISSGGIIVTVRKLRRRKVGEAAVALAG